MLLYSAGTGVVLCSFCITTHAMLAGLARQAVLMSPCSSHGHHGSACITAKQIVYCFLQAVLVMNSDDAVAEFSQLHSLPIPGILLALF